MADSCINQLLTHNLDPSTPFLPPPPLPCNQGYRACLSTTNQLLQSINVSCLCNSLGRITCSLHWGRCSICKCSQHLHAGLAFGVTALHVVGLSLLHVVVQMQYSRADGGVAPRYDEGEDMVRQLQANQTGVDDRLHQSQIQLFKNRQLIASRDQIADAAPGAAAAGTQDGGSESEGGESDSEEGDSEDDSESEETEEDDDEEEESAGAGASLKAMPQEQIEVSLFELVMFLHHTQVMCFSITLCQNLLEDLTAQTQNMLLIMQKTAGWKSWCLMLDPCPHLVM